MIYFTGDIHGYPWDVKKFCTKMKLTEEDKLISSNEGAKVLNP